MRNIHLVLAVIGVLFVVTACTTESRGRSLVSTHTYPDKVFSVGGFFTVMDQYENDSVVIRGIVSYVYTCPPCAAGDRCKPCDEPHIIIMDVLQKGRATVTVYDYEYRGIFDTVHDGDTVVVNGTYVSLRREELLKFPILSLNSLFVDNSFQE